jgi:hypothetical protein
MPDKPQNNARVRGEVILYAFIMLIGIVTLALGRFYDITILFYCGIFVTLAGVLLEILQVINQKQK